ncbi:MAG: Na+/H+ antiporter NhaC family protein [Endomicrobium sp.]|jgi:Na+/H+ antiporter NhaC|nr:Na+/H+ antiporter NhaC family protein [Endomicrobium sp.]
MIKHSRPLTQREANPLALLPLFIFLAVYLIVSIAVNDFYKMPITVAFCVGVISALIMVKGGTTAERTEIFCRGAGNSNIMLMTLIFILAGAFAQTSKDMGAVDATVNLTLSIIPASLIVPGLFIAACLVSVSVGTSVGTVVALVPIAAGIAVKTDISSTLLAAAVVSGAMFGDNLSVISDTTIVATRTQGCNMKDKFRANWRIVWPYAVLTVILYAVAAGKYLSVYQPEDINWIKMLPYSAVLIMAIIGIDVIIVLISAILFSGITGILCGSFNMWGWTAAMGSGILSMGELIIITLLAGGMFELIKFNGAINWLIQTLTSRIKTRKGAELSIGAITSFCNFCTANNTIALIMAGPIAKEIAVKYKISAKRSASIMDIFSCAIQGAIPYGAQLLMAATLAGISPISIMKYAYYPYLLAAGAIIAIIFANSRKTPPDASA